MQTDSLQYGLPGINWSEAMPWIIIGGIIVLMCLGLWLLMQPWAKKHPTQHTRNSGPYYGSASTNDDNNNATDGWGSDAGGSDGGSG